MTQTGAYPRREGDVIILGPEIFASSDGAVICWKGENYVRQDAVRKAAATRTTHPRVIRLCGPCAAGQCTGPGRGGICEHSCHHGGPS